MVGIYKITSPSGKVYIGQSWYIERRKKEYSYLRNVKGQTLLNRSYLKYGLEAHSFELIHSLPEDVNQEVLDRYEELYIQQYRECGVGSLNLKAGGKNSKHAQETRQRISKSHTGKKMSSGAVERSAEKRRGSKWTEEQRRKLSLLRKGYEQSEEHARKRAESRKGWKVPEEQRERQSRKMKGRPAWNKGKKKVVDSLGNVSYI